MENVYLVKTSVIFAIRRHDGCTEGRTMKENFMTYEDGNLQGQLGRNFMCILVALKVYGCYVLEAIV